MNCRAMIAWRGWQRGSVMKKYSVLTKHINLLENDNAGEWSCDKENDGSRGKTDAPSFRQLFYNG